MLDRDEDDLLDDETSGTIFRDVIMLALCGFVAVVVLLLPHINPKVEAKEQQTIAPPGDVVVEILWPDTLDVDVDLWVLAPGDVPVGYSNKGGYYFNLLRDDLGHRADPTNINYEVSYTRGAPAGEYVVNLHLYRNNDGVYPVPVKVLASLRRSDRFTTTRLVETRVELNREGREVTAFRFTLGANGELVAGSVNSLQKDLRSAWSK